METRKMSASRSAYEIAVLRAKIDAMKLEQQQQQQQQQQQKQQQQTTTTFELLQELERRNCEIKENEEIKELKEEMRKLLEKTERNLERKECYKELEEERRRLMEEEGEGFDSLVEDPDIFDNFEERERVGGTETTNFTRSVLQGEKKKGRRKGD